MRPTFILTRMFAISALLVGAAQIVCAAPIAEVRAASVVVAPGVEAAVDLAREVPIEARTPFENLDAVKRVAEVADPAPPDSDELEDIEARTCAFAGICRREQD